MRIYSVYFLTLIVLLSGCSLFRTGQTPLPTPSSVHTTAPMDTTVASGMEVEDNGATYVNYFGGESRYEAKTIPSEMEIDSFYTMDELIATLPPDDSMRAIGISETSGRTEEEDRNVYVAEALLFSIKKEADNDFHLIVGDTVNGERVHLMNMEISGLPEDTTSAAYYTLRHVRHILYNRYPEFFDGHRKSLYFREQPPLISIQGSLFFDIHHTAGQIGSGLTKPKSVWEVHPITDILFYEE